VSRGALLSGDTPEEPRPTKNDFPVHRSAGPLPPGAPPVCEEFRRPPAALDRATALDAASGRNPHLARMPMYGIVFSFKDPFDTRDMRTTAGGDADYDIDFPARDHVLVAQLRKKGASIFAKAVCTEYNGRAGNPGGRQQLVPREVRRTGARIRSDRTGHARDRHPGAGARATRGDRANGGGGRRVGTAGRDRSGPDRGRGQGDSRR